MKGFLDELRLYKERGYVVAKSLRIIEPIKTGEYAFRRLAEARERSVDAFRCEARLIAREVSVNRMFCEIRHLPFVVRLIRRPVFQTAPVLHAMGFDESFDGTHAHQDWPALQSGLNTLVAWVPLHDVTEDSFPLEVVPGSHLRGLLPATPGAHYSEVDTTGMEFVPVSVPAGAVLFMSVFLVHRTRTPGTKKRIALSHRYEDALDPWFRMNGCYSAQSRVIDREIRNVPPVDAVRNIFYL